MSVNELVSRTFQTSGSDGIPQATNTGAGSDGASDKIVIEDLTAVVVMITSTGTVSAGTILTQVSNDGTDWFTVDDTQDAANALSERVPLVYDHKYVRVKCTENIAGAAGVVAATCAGRKAWR